MTLPIGTRASYSENQMPWRSKQVADLTHLGKYDKAIKIARAALQVKFTKEECKNLGHLYCDAKYYDESIKTFMRIHGWENNPSVVQAISISYTRKGEHQKAIDVLKSYPGWEDNGHILCCLALIHQSLGQFKIAIKIFNSNTLVLRDAYITIAFGRCYEAMGKFDIALDVYGAVKHLNPPQVLQNMARCYEQMGDIPKTIETFEKLVKRNPEPHFFIPFARFYQDQGEFEKAIATFQRTEGWEDNTKVLMGIGCCYEAWKKYDLAIRYFKKIRNWDLNVPVIMSLARCYEKMKEFANAEATYRMDENWKQNARILLSLARLKQVQYESSGELGELYEDVARYFQMLPNWQENLAALKGLIWLYLRAYASDQAQKYLKISLKLFPDNAEFYELQSLYYHLRNRHEANINFLVSAIEKFPNNTLLHLRLMESYLKTDQKTSAEYIRTICLKRFASNHKFLKQMEKLFTATARGISESKWNYVSLTNEISQAFSFLGEESDVYLVGSTVIDLLLGNEPSQDFDFSTNDPKLGQSLENLGFTPIKFIPGLFRKYAGRGTPEIDLMNSTAKAEDEPWIKYDVPTRDFTICGLYCDRHGKVYDPTGRGIQDVKTKTLATVIDPNLCFQEDPICVLRGLKYIGRGFTPTPEVERAIEHWKPTDPKYVPHMAAVLRKLFRTNSNFLDLLHKYKLTDKLRDFFSVNGHEHVSRLLPQKKALRYTEKTFISSRKVSLI